MTYESKEELRLDLEKIGKVQPKPITFELAEKPLEERFVTVDITPKQSRTSNCALAKH